jgi:hypothetical protein
VFWQACLALSFGVVLTISRPPKWADNICDCALSSINREKFTDCGFGLYIHAKLSATYAPPP